MKIAGYDVHPIAEHFPMLDAKRFDSLVASIEANGQRDPVAIFEGRLLDGRNRARACEKLGINPKVIAFVGDPWSYVWDKNGERRDLEVGQRTLIRVNMEAAQVAEETAKEADRARSEKLKGVPRADRARSNERTLSKGRDKTAKKIAAKAKSSPASAASAATGVRHHWRRRWRG